MSLSITLFQTMPTDVYGANITHNLNEMADAAGIYKHLWRPEELGFTKAGELIPGLEIGLAFLLANPGICKAHNPSNGWGKYEDLVAFVNDYLEACREFPEAAISVSR